MIQHFLRCIDMGWTLDDTWSRSPGLQSYTRAGLVLMAGILMSGSRGGGGPTLPSWRGGRRGGGG